MKILLSLCLLAFTSVDTLLQPVVTTNQTRPAFRTVDVYRRNIGFSYFESMAITSREDFDAFLKELPQQVWNDRQNFVDALVKAQIDFDREALVLLRHDESSGSAQVVFETPVLKEKTLLCEIRGVFLADGGTMDMANYCFVLVVSKRQINQVQLNAVVGFPKRRPLPQILLPLNERRPLKFVRPHGGE
jgi:hypothetical protein